MTTGVPKEITDHREYLAAKKADVGGEWGRLVAEIAAIDFCIAAIEDAAKAPNAEAGEGGTVFGNPKMPGVKVSPAGDAVALSGIGPKKPRAPKRDILGVVWRYVESNQSSQPKNAIEIAAALGLLPREVDKALAYWQARGRLTLDGGAVRLWTERVDHIGNVTELVEIAGPREEIPADDYSDEAIMARRALIDFLTRTPDSTMAEINAAGIDAVELWRAEREGVVMVKAHGLYVLVEPQQSEVAE